MKSTQSDNQQIAHDIELLRVTQSYMQQYGATALSQFLEDWKSNFAKFSTLSASDANKIVTSLVLYTAYKDSL